MCLVVVELARGQNPGAFKGNRLDYLKYISLFVLIQLTSFVLNILGIIPVALAVALERTRVMPNGIIHFTDHFMWIWDNEEDGIEGFLPFSKWDEFDWSELRNPVANLRHVRGVSGVGRPMFYRTWVSFNKQFYVKAGWMSDGFPALSAGAGKGF